MAVGLRKSWLFAAMALALLGVLVFWAWSDGGIRPLSPQTAPARLPQVGQ